MSLAPDRQKFIGSSEVACLLGVDPYRTKYALWMEKSGRVEPDDLSRRLVVQAGNHLEPFVAQWWARENARPIKRAQSYVKHPKVEGAGASLDYLITDHCPEEVMEIKTVNHRAYQREWTDTPPLRYVLQVQYQMMLTGAPAGRIVAYVPGEPALVDVPVKEHAKTQDLMLASVKAFWESVHADNPPDPDFERDQKVINARSALATAMGQDDTTVEAPNDDVGNAIVRLNELTAVFREATREKNRCQAIIKEALLATDAARLSYQGYTATITRIPEAPRKAYIHPAHTRINVRAPRAAQ